MSFLNLDQLEFMVIIMDSVLDDITEILQDKAESLTNFRRDAADHFDSEIRETHEPRNPVTQERLHGLLDQLYRNLEGHSLQNEIITTRNKLDRLAGDPLPEPSALDI